MTSPSAARAHPGWRAGHLSGVPVFIGRSWLLIAGVIVLLFGPVVSRLMPELGGAAYVVAGVFAVLLLVSVLAHEAAHALVAQAAGYRVNRIVADFWGGHTAYDSADSTPGRSALVAVAGPLANGALAGLGYLVTQVAPPGLAWLLAIAFTYANAFVAAFNLLPGLPLDGGFLVESLVWRLTGSRATGMLVGGWSGRVLILLLVGWVVGLPLLRGDEVSMTRVIWGALIGSFLWMGASDAIRVARARRVFERITVGSVCRPVAVVPADRAVAFVPPVPPGTDILAVDAQGRPIGVIDPEALARVPGPLRAGTPVGAVVHAQPEGWVVTAGPEESVTPLVVAMQSLRTPVVAVRSPAGELLGIVRAQDV